MSLALGDDPVGLRTLEPKTMTTTKTVTQGNAVTRAMSTAGTALLLLGTLASSANAQSAAEVIDRMLTEHERRSAAVDDYTLVQEVMGLETISYFEKQMVDGRPVFQLRRTGAMGMEMDSPTEGTLDEIYAMGEDLAESARYVGREAVGGSDAHVLDLPDLQGTDFGRNMSPDSEFTPTSGRFYVDADTYVPLRMDFEGEMTTEQGTSPIRSTIEMSDYREVEGMLMPYRTDVRIEGLGAAIDDETRAEFEKMQSELEQMPEAQRRMVEAMMADQLAQFRQMMEDDSAPMLVEVVVREIRVNTGPPGN